MNHSKIKKIINFLCHSTRSRLRVKTLSFISASSNVKFAEGWSNVSLDRATLASSCGERCSLSRVLSLPEGEVLNTKSTVHYLQSPVSDQIWIRNTNDSGELGWQAGLCTAKNLKNNVLPAFHVLQSGANKPVLIFCFGFKTNREGENVCVTRPLFSYDKIMNLSSWVQSYALCPESNEKMNLTITGWRGLKASRVYVPKYQRQNCWVRRLPASPLLPIFLGKNLIEIHKLRQRVFWYDTPIMPWKHSLNIVCDIEFSGRQISNMSFVRLNPVLSLSSWLCKCFFN